MLGQHHQSEGDQTQCKRQVQGKKKETEEKQGSAQIPRNLVQEKSKLGQTYYAKSFERARAEGKLDLQMELGPEKETEHGARYLHGNRPLNDLRTLYVLENTTYI
jgi:hypothetical protein